MATTVGTFLAKLAFDSSNFEGGARAAQAQLGQFGNTLTRMSNILNTVVVRAFQASALAMGAFAYKTVQTGAEFEQTMTTVAAVSGATEAQMQSLTDAARELGATTAYSASQAGEGMIELARAGLSADQVISATGASLFLAGASASEMTQATGIMASTIRQFGLDAGDANRISDVFTAALNSSMLSMSSLTEAMKYAGVTGRSLNMSLESTTAAVAQFRNLGLEGSLAGNAFKMGMIAMRKEGDNTRAVFEKIGLTLQDIDPSVVGFGTMLEELAGTTFDLDDATMLFGSRAGMAYNTLIEQVRAGNGNFAELEEILLSSGGVAEETYGQMTDTVTGQFAIMKSAIEELMLVVFETFGGDLKALLQEMSAIIGIVAREFSRGAAGIGAGFSEGIGGAIEYLKANRAAVAMTFVGFIDSVKTAITWLARILPLLDDIAQLLATLWVANKVRIFVAAIGTAVTAFQGMALATGGATAAIRTFMVTLTAASGGTYALVAAIGVVVASFVNWAMSADDTREAEERLAATQAQIEADAQARAERAAQIASERASATAEATHALQLQLLETDQLTAALDRELTAVEALTEGQIANGIASGELFRATVNGEDVVLSYAAAAEMAAAGVDGGTEAVRQGTEAINEHVRENNRLLGELRTLAQAKLGYDRAVAAGHREGAAQLVYLENLGHTYDTLTVAIDTATAAYDAQHEILLTARATRDAANRSVEETEARERAAARATASANEEAASGTERSTARRTTSTRNYQREWERAHQARIRAMNKEQDRYTDLISDETTMLTRGLHERVQAIEEAFDAEVAAARRAGREIESIEMEREMAVDFVRWTAAEEAVAMREQIHERLMAEREKFHETERDRLRAAHSENLAEIESAIALEIEASTRASENRLQDLRNELDAVSSLPWQEAARERARLEPLILEIEKGIEEQVTRIQTEGNMTRLAANALYNRELKHLRMENAARLEAALRQSAAESSSRLEAIERERQARLTEYADEGALARKQINEEYDRRVVAETERVADQLRRITGRETAEIAALEDRLASTRTERGKERIRDQIAVARSILAVAQRYDRFIESEADLTADQIAELERAKAQEIANINDVARKDAVKKNAGYLREISSATVDAVKQVAGAAINVAKKAAGAFGSIFGAFTGGLGVDDILGSFSSVASDIASEKDSLEEQLASGEISQGEFDAGMEALDASEMGSDFINELIDGAVDFIGVLIEGIPAILTTLGERLPELLTLLAESIPIIVQSFADHIGIVLEALIAGLPGVIQGIINAIPVLVDSIVYLLEEVLPQLLDTLLPLLGNLIDALIDAMPRIADALMSALPNIVSFLVDAITQILESLPEIITHLLNAIAQAIPILMEGIALLIQAIFDAIPSILISIIEAIPKLIPALIEGLLTVVISIIQALPELLNQIFTEVLPSLLENLILMVAGLVEAVFEALPLIVQGIVELIPSLIASIISMIPKLLEGILNSLPTLITSLIVGIVGSIPQILIALVAAIPKLVVTLIEVLIKEILIKLPWISIQIVLAIFQALWDSIKTLVQILGDAFREAFSWLTDLFERDKDGDGWFSDTPGVIHNATSDPLGAMFAPGDYVAAAKDPMDLAQMAISEVASGAASAVARSSLNQPPALPTSRGGSGSSAPIDIAVVAEGRVLDSVQVTALDRGHAPKMEQKLRKASGVKVGFNRGRFSKYTG